MVAPVRRIGLSERIGTGIHAPTLAASSTLYSRRDIFISCVPESKGQLTSHSLGEPV